MLLVGVKEQNGWLSSRWHFTYKQGFEKISKAVFSVYDFYNHPEILLDDKLIEIRSKDCIQHLKESSKITIRGVSKIVDVPLTITFYNQTNIIDASVMMSTDEFSAADYEKFNKSLCQYMDSIEIAIYV